MLFTFILSLLLALVLCGAVYIICFPSLSQRIYPFTDIIIETIARTGFDKGAELKLFWSLLVLGILVMALIVFLSGKITGKRTKKQTNRYSFPQIPVYTLIAIFPLLVNMILYQKAGTLLFLAPIYVLGVLFFQKKLPMSREEELALPVLLYYTVLAILTTLFYFTDQIRIRSSVLIAIVAGLTVVMHFLKPDGIRRCMALMQCVIPLLLMVYLVDTYLYQGEMIHVRFAPFYYVFFILLMLFLIGLSVRNVKTCFTAKARLSCAKLISISTPITIFIYNSFSACPLYAQPDQHHHGEQMIPWQQIVTLGQSAYEEYTPVSGLFPMVNGFIQNVLMRGTVSDYSPAISITMVLFCIVTMVLICFHVGNAYSLCFAVFFALPSYNRQYMVLPLLLLLFLPKLLEKPLLWLLTWIYACFFAGLYYPLYGAAALVGTLPLGMKMLMTLRNKMDWSDAHKKTLPFTRCILCLLPILFSIPLLFRILNHTLTYSSQTQMADGITLFGQTPPDFFMPCLTTSHATVRQWLYLSYRFLLPMLAVWLFTLLLLLAYKNNKHLLFISLAGVLTLCVSYTYTLVRADTGVILSRTAPILIAVCGMFLPILLLSYRRRGMLSIQPLLFMLLLGICFSTPSMIYQKVSHMKFPDMWIYPNGEAALIMDDTDKLYHHYEVPSFFVKMDDISLQDKSMLGNGFMVSDQTGYLTQYESVMKKCETALKTHAVSDVIPEVSYMGFDGQGFYYYLNARACSTGFIQAGKGYAAQQKILSQVKEKRPVIFLIEPQCNYYVYVWMMEHDYVYQAGDGAFYPLELYCLIYDENVSDDAFIAHGESMTEQENIENAAFTSAYHKELKANGMVIGDDYRLSCPQTDLGRVCSSFGASYDLLRPLFLHETDISQWQDKETINGLKNDFLYLAWDPNKTDAFYQDCQKDGYEKEHPLTLSIHFTCDGKTYDGAVVSCQITDQNLLIPMGMNAAWLLSENSDIMVTISDAEGKPLLTDSLQAFARNYFAKASFLNLAQER